MKKLVRLSNLPRVHSKLPGIEAQICLNYDLVLRTFIIAQKQVSPNPTPFTE